jgi:hypothetical protein
VRVAVKIVVFFVAETYNLNKHFEFHSKNASAHKVEVKILEANLERLVNGELSAHEIEVNRGPLWGTYLNFMSTCPKMSSAIIESKYVRRLTSFNSYVCML